ncbi:MAG: hypothetical protein H6825_00905 [Planctomycetes bacterium]|nr:hypothetical protein [Planctomycetota bacterium]
MPPLKGTGEFVEPRNSTAVADAFLFARPSATASPPICAPLPERRHAAHAGEAEAERVPGAPRRRC